MPVRKALLVGMNHYPNPRNELPSCENDASRFHELLVANYGFPAENCRLVLSQAADPSTPPEQNAASKRNVLGHLDWLFSGLNDGDIAVFYYSGHGYRTNKDGVMRDCICLYDDFLFGNEFSALTGGLPGGILSVMLDSCFSGGMDKTYFVAYDAAGTGVAEPGVTKNKFFWADAEQASKDFEDQQRPLPYQPFGGPVIPVRRPLIVEDALKAFSLQKAFVGPSGVVELTAADVVSKELDQPLNGLLITACNAEEKAAASTPATSGLSAFTYCLLSAWTDMRRVRSLDQLACADLHADAGTRLRQLNLTQTPLIKEPPVPPGLASRSFINLAVVPGASPALDSNGHPAVTDGPAPNPANLGGVARIEDLVRMVLGQMGKSEGGSTKGMDPMVTATAPTATALGTVPGIDDKGFWDVFNQVAPVALQLVSALTKEYEGTSKSMSVASVSIPSAADKGFWDYFNKIAPVALQVIGAVTGGKAFADGSATATSPTLTAMRPASSVAMTMQDKGFWDVFHQVAPYVIQIASTLSKSYNPSTKEFSATMKSGTVSVDDLPPATDKGFWDVVSSVAQVAVPILISAL
jgi:hypothetical protein